MEDPARTELAVTPELALVDPELAAQLRRTLVATPAALLEVERRRRSDAEARAAALALAEAESAAALAAWAEAEAEAQSQAEAEARAEEARDTARVPAAPAPRPKQQQAPKPAPIAVAPQPAEPISGPEPIERPRWSAFRVAKITAATVAATALLGLAFLPPRQAPHLGEDPDASASATRPSLTWLPIAAARSYRVELYADDQLVHAEDTALTRLTLPVWLPQRRYAWRVYAKLAGDGSAAPSWRLIDSGSVAAPAPSTP